eukprot:g4187.t1
MKQRTPTKKAPLPHLRDASWMSAEELVSNPSPLHVRSRNDIEKEGNSESSSNSDKSSHLPPAKVPIKTKNAIHRNPTLTGIQLLHYSSSRSLLADANRKGSVYDASNVTANSGTATLAARDGKHADNADNAANDFVLSKSHSTTDKNDFTINEDVHRVTNIDEEILLMNDKQYETNNKQDKTNKQAEQKKASFKFLLCDHEMCRAIRPPQGEIVVEPWKPDYIYLKWESPVKNILLIKKPDPKPLPTDTMMSDNEDYESGESESGDYSDSDVNMRERPPRQAATTTITDPTKTIAYRACELAIFLLKNESLSPDLRIWLEPIVVEEILSSEILLSLFRKNDIDVNKVFKTWKREEQQNRNSLYKKTQKTHAVKDNNATVILGSKDNNIVGKCRTRETTKVGNNNLSISNPLDNKNESDKRPTRWEAESRSRTFRTSLTCSFGTLSPSPSPERSKSKNADKDTVVVASEIVTRTKNKGEAKKATDNEIAKLDTFSNETNKKTDHMKKKTEEDNEDTEKKKTSDQASSWIDERNEPSISVLEVSKVIDLVVTFGGDGTLLWTSKLLQRSLPPIVSIAMGSLGFLTTFELSEIREKNDDRTQQQHLSSSTTASTTTATTTKAGRNRSLSTRSRSRSQSSPSPLPSPHSPTYYGDGSKSKLISLISNGGYVTLRSRLEVTLVTRRQRKEKKKHGGAEVDLLSDNSSMYQDIPPTAHVLNEVVVDRGNLGTVVNLDVLVNKQKIAHVVADGVIISTPT